MARPTLLMLPGLLATRRVFQPQNVLHVVKPGRSLGEPACRAHGTTGERRPALRLVGDLHPLALTRKEHGVIPNHIPPTDGGKAYRRGIALAGHACGSSGRMPRRAISLRSSLSAGFGVVSSFSP